MNSSSSKDGPPPVPTGAVTVSVSAASKTSSPFAVEQAPPPTDPEAVLRARYGGLLPAHKRRGPTVHKGHLHQHFDSADWSMAKARGGTPAATAAPSSSSSLSAASHLLLPLGEEVAPPRLAPEQPPAPRRASHLGEASK